MFVYLLSFFPSPIWLSSEFCICRAAFRHLCCDTDIFSPKTEIAVLQFQSSYAHSLTSALHYLVPVRPRRQIVYPLEKLGINAPSKAVSKAPVGSPAAAGRRRGASSCGCGRWGGSTVFSGAGCFLITGSLALVPLKGCPEEAPLQPFTSGGYFPVSLKQEAQDPSGDRPQGPYREAFACCCVSGQVAWSEPLSIFLSSFPCSKADFPFPSCFAFKAKWSLTIGTKLTEKIELAAFKMSGSES